MFLYLGQLGHFPAGAELESGGSEQIAADGQEERPPGRLHRRR